MEAYNSDVSSANNLDRLEVFSAMSLIYNTKYRGPSTDPWGTPPLIVPVPDRKFPINTF